jgi:hypothetical protein
MYEEILEIENFCKDNNINTVKTPLWGGWKLEFDDGADIVQHSFSYMNGECVEPAGFGEDIDYCPIPCEDMKKIILKKYKGS